MTSAVARIVAREIDRETFAPFGQLLETPGEGWRLDFAAAISDGRRVSRPNLALIRARPAPERLRIDRLECHPYSSQAFFPLDVSDTSWSCATMMGWDIPTCGALRRSW